MAILVLGGLLTSTFLNLPAIPVIYTSVDDVLLLLLKAFRKKAEAGQNTDCSVPAINELQDWRSIVNYGHVRPGETVGVLHYNTVGANALTDTFDCAGQYQKIASCA